MQVSPSCHEISDPQDAVWRVTVVSMHPSALHVPSGSFRTAPLGQESHFSTSASHVSQAVAALQRVHVPLAASSLWLLAHESHFVIFSSQVLQGAVSAASIGQEAEAKYYRRMSILRTLPASWAGKIVMLNVFLRSMCMGVLQC